MVTPGALAHMLSLCSLAALSACGGRVVVDEKAGPASCELPQLAAEGPFTAETCAGRCTLGAVGEDGAPVRLACDGQRCVLFVDGAERCTCTELDFASTCANGVPLCQHLANFNFAAAVPLGCATP
jgi:hypothetical protein